ncbi:hypothetical protein C8J57DRAFT_1721032, partial [Mycena rebaudengoi]
CPLVTWLRPSLPASPVHPASPFLTLNGQPQPLRRIAALPARAQRRAGALLLRVTTGLHSSCSDSTRPALSSRNSAGRPTLICASPLLYFARRAPSIFTSTTRTSPSFVHTFRWAFSLRRLSISHCPNSSRRGGVPPCDSGVLASLLPRETLPHLAYHTRPPCSTVYAAADLGDPSPPVRGVRCEPHASPIIRLRFSAPSSLQPPSVYFSQSPPPLSSPCSLLISRTHTRRTHGWRGCAHRLVLPLGNGARTSCAATQRARAAPRGALVLRNGRAPVTDASPLLCANPLLIIYDHD